MTKKKCNRCGYSFKPKEENETICELCKFQLEGVTPDGKCEFNVKQLGSLDIKGKMRLTPEELVFEPAEVYFKDKKLNLSISKIKDVRFSTAKEISALRVWLLGAPLGALFKKKNNLLTIDYEDEYGLIQHPIFEGEDVETVVKKLNEIRKNQRIQNAR